jgi:outer membrane protein OmpA-like peptidoglycan-associated protein
MKRVGFAVLAVGFAAALASAGGCCAEEKKQLAELSSQYNDLSVQKQDLQEKLNQSKTREMELENQLAQAGNSSADVQRLNQELLRLQAELKSGSAAAGGSGVWDVGKYADRVTVGSDILFASGQAKLTSAGKAALDKIAADVKSKYSGMPVRVYGYTDSDVISKTKDLWQDNLDLSANRAMSVTRYLIDKGVSPDNVETVAMGQTHYVAPNNSPASKAKNRRVEIVVIKQ